MSNCGCSGCSRPLWLMLLNSNILNNRSPVGKPAVDNSYRLSLFIAFSAVLGSGLSLWLTGLDVLA